MAVAVLDNGGRAELSGGANTLDLTMTVSSGSNLALIGGLLLADAANAGTVAIVWDPTGANQSLANITGTIFNTTRYLTMFALVNPTPGASKILHASWTSNDQAILGGISFTGVDQTGGATSFPNGTTTSGAANPATIVVTSAVNDYTAGIFMTVSGSLDSGLNWFFDNNLSTINGGGVTAAGASPNVTVSAAQNAANSYFASATDIKAAGGGGGSTGIGGLIAFERGRMVGGGLLIP